MVFVGYGISDPDYGWDDIKDVSLGGGLLRGRRLKSRPLLTVVPVVSVADVVTLLLGSFRGSVSLAVASLGVIAWLCWRGNRALSASGGLAFEHEEPGTQALGLGA
jgi:hypothetical protein